jgi:hypothetical protein
MASDAGHVARGLLPNRSEPFLTTAIRSNSDLANLGAYQAGWQRTPAQSNNQASVEAYHAQSQRRFVLITLLLCLVLQRFALPTGSQSAPISVVTPLVAVMVFWYISKGVLSFDRKRVGIMAGLVGIALISVSLQKNMPIAMVSRNSLISLMYWLGVTGFSTLRFTKPMEERPFFNILIGCLAFIAVCGIGEFFAQFVGLRLFTFSGFVPARFSVETLYNVVIPLGSSFIKSNGFFLVEPSVFSQFMAVGLVCEWMERRRKLYIALFLFALFCSVSGTGWLVVGAFLVYNGLTKGGRGLWVAMILSCVCVIAFVAVSFIFPAITESLSGRVHEINMPGTSGNARFVTPFLVLRHVFGVAPYAFFTGIGPGGSDSLAGITYEYNMNTPTKVILEYGIFGLLMYVALLLCNRRTSRQTSMLPPILVLLLFAGAYEHFPPILFPVLLVVTVCNLKPEPDSPVNVTAPGLSGVPAVV